LSDPGDDHIVEYVVDWGDGTSPVSYGPSDPISHVYTASSASRTVTLSARDEDGLHHAIATHQVAVLASASMSISDVALLEGNGSGTTAFVFTVTLSAAVDQEVRVTFGTRDLTARVSANDYFATSGTLTFAPNTLTQTITVQVRRDSTIEADEQFAVDLSGLAAPSGVSLLDASGLGTVLTDDRLGGRPGRG
jgi:hypothetical protein